MSQSPRKLNSKDNVKDKETVVFNKHHAVLCNSKLAKSYPVTKNLTYSLAVHNSSSYFKLQTNSYIASIISSRIQPKTVVNADNDKDNDKDNHEDNDEDNAEDNDKDKDEDNTVADKDDVPVVTVARNAKNDQDNIVGNEDIVRTDNTEYDKNGILRWLGTVSKPQIVGGVDYFVFLQSSFDLHIHDDIVTFLKFEKNLTKKDFQDFRTAIATLQQTWITMKVKWDTFTKYLRSLLRLIQWTVPYWDNLFSASEINKVPQFIFDYLQRLFVRKEKKGNEINLSLPPIAGLEKKKIPIHSTIKYAINVPNYSNGPRTPTQSHYFFALRASRSTNPRILYVMDPAKLLI